MLSSSSFFWPRAGTAATGALGAALATGFATAGATAARAGLLDVAAALE